MMTKPVCYRAVILTVLFGVSSAWDLPSILSESVPSIPDVPVASINTVQLETDREVQETTDSPTESPAPSPSPSEIPTMEPTFTGSPTPSPSAMPTESPAPSPSPSEIPTVAPSDSPSSFPTNHPTVSSMPSTSPSASPTNVPSTSPSAGPSPYPTVSSMPSSSPTASPSDQPSASPSDMPSSSPTHIDTVAAVTDLTLPLEVIQLNGTEVTTFENVTAEFIELVPYATGRLADAVVTLMDQGVVEVTNSTKEPLQDVFTAFRSKLSLEQALEIQVVVEGTYIGSDVDFDFSKELDSAFETYKDQWFLLLAQSGIPVFEPLLPEGPSQNTPSFSQKPDRGNASSGGMSSGAAAAVSLLTIAAMAIGVVASVYGIRKYKAERYGGELNSPVSNFSTAFKQSTEEMDVCDEEENDEEKPKMKNAFPTPDACKKTNCFCHEDNSSDISPSGFDEIVPKRGRSLENAPPPPPPPPPPQSYSWSQKQSQQSNRAKDPPTSHTETYQKPDPRNMTSLFDNNTEVSFGSRAARSYHESNHEIMLTRSQGGTLGAEAVTGSTAGSGFTTSDFSNRDGSFFATGEGNHSSRNLGARAPSSDEVQQLKEKGSYDSMVHRVGLYDVFAPAGPIGIVVDTTKYGPSVHSLKRTSPMLGLINPGDLIVGLDDEDTRGMTAATLTRLMARKSNQKERKITLLTVEN